MNKTFVRTIFPIIAVILFLIVVIPDLFRDTNCEIFNEFISLRLNGVVVQKYIDSSQHSNEVVVIKQFDNLRLQKVIFDLDRKGSFEKIKVHDTLFKEFKNDTIFKIISNQKTFLTKVDFGCATY